MIISLVIAQKTSRRRPKQQLCKKTEDCKFGGLCLPHRRNKSLKSCQCRNNCNDFPQHMVCAKTMDSLLYGEPTIFLNACLLRLAECKMQSSYPILCRGDDLCGNNYCNLDTDYFDYPDYDSSGKIDVSNAMKGKSSGGGKSSSSNKNLKVSTICPANKWNCDVTMDGSNRIEHGICVMDFMGLTSCECSVKRIGESCSLAASKDPNTTANPAAWPASLQNIGVCPNGNCNQCWMFGIMSMIVLVVVVAILIRRTPMIAVHQGQNGSLVTQSSTTGGGFKGRTRCNSTMSKYSSVNQLQSLLPQNQDKEEQKDHLTISKCLSASSSKHEFSPEMGDLRPLNAPIHTKRDSLSVPFTYKQNSNDGHETKSPMKVVGMPKNNSNASLLSNKRVPSFTLGDSNIPRNIIKVGSSSNFEEDTHLTRPPMRGRTNSLRITNRPKPIDITKVHQKRSVDSDSSTGTTTIPLKTSPIKKTWKSHTISSDKKISHKNSFEGNQGLCLTINEPIIEILTPSPGDMVRSKSSSDIASSINTLNSYGTSSTKLEDQKQKPKPNLEVNGNITTEESGRDSMDVFS